MAAVIVDIGKRHTAGRLRALWQSNFQAILRFHHIGIHFPALATAFQRQNAQRHIQRTVVGDHQIAALALPFQRFSLLLQVGLQGLRTVEQFDSGTDRHLQHVILLRRWRYFLYVYPEQTFSVLR
ncbi:hypothetical protein D3C79_964220 [compost metagenome]